MVRKGEKLAETVRDGQIVWPFCPTCGCRLDITLLHKSNLALLQHYWHPEEAKDARGCDCESANETWYVSADRVQHFI